MNETVTRWSVQLYLSEVDGHTHAEARLLSGVEPPLSATGTAALNEKDRLDVPEIGYELAAARALQALAEALQATAADDVQALST
ncbi:MAG: dsRBD fold-containing protein [Nocardioides sp.]